MSTGRARLGAAPLGLFLIASTVVAVVAVRVAINRETSRRSREPNPVAVAIVAPPDELIRAEAQVFRTTAAIVAIEPSAPRERVAHPRRLATVHFLRGFPGAPPSIPHSLAADEYRTARCRTCHERGGFSERFTAYVPLTPHPDRGICVQCHVGVDSAIGGEVPDPNPNGRCPLCHARSGGPPRPDASLTWATTTWPQLSPTTAGENPPPIPHDLSFRENCLTCHSGPAAVAEIRTKHPERANCRQCHVVLDLGAEAFTRPAEEAAPKARGTL